MGKGHAHASACRGDLDGALQGVEEWQWRCAPHSRRGTPCLQLRIPPPPPSMRFGWQPSLHSVAQHHLPAHAPRVRSFADAEKPPSGRLGEGETVVHLECEVTHLYPLPQSVCVGSSVSADPGVSPASSVTENHSAWRTAHAVRGYFLLPPYQEGGCRSQSCAYFASDDASKRDLDRDNRCRS